MDLENQNSQQEQQVASEQHVHSQFRLDSNSYNFRESLTAEYLRKNKKERQLHYGIQLGYFISLLFFGVVFVFDLTGSAESILGPNTSKNYCFYINQLVYFIVQIIQQAIRYRLIRHNYDFFDSRKPKVLIISFVSFFFMENLIILFFLIGNIAHSQLQNKHQQITEYITVSKQVIACIVILFLEVILGFYNNLLLVYTLKRRMKNTIVNRILAQSQIRPNEYLALQQYLQTLNIQSQSRFSQSSVDNISTSDDTHSQNQRISQKHIKSDLASNLIKQKDFIVYGEDTNSNEKQDFTCSICQIEINMEDKVIYLQCKHLYHSDCLQLWLVNHHTCPFCRQVVW